MNYKPFSNKRRIHEVTYAQKVISKIIPDVANIKLNENLFHAQQMARHSSTLIKDIQKDVKTTLKKYDSFVKLSETNRKHPDKYPLSSNRKYQSESPLRDKTSAEKQLETLREQQKLLMSLLNNLQQQEKLITSQTLPQPEPYPKIVEEKWFANKAKQLQQIQKSQIMSENRSPKKLDSSEVIQVDLSKVKRSPNSKASSAQNFFSASKSVIRGSVNIAPISCQSYAKIHRKESNSPMKWSQYGALKNQGSQKNLNVSKRNEAWKQRVDNKIKNEAMRLQEQQKQVCTFKPKLNKPNSNQGSKEYSNDLNEIMYLIDDLNYCKTKPIKK